MMLPTNWQDVSGIAGGTAGGAGAGAVFNKRFAVLVVNPAGEFIGGQGAPTVFDHLSAGPLAAEATSVITVAGVLASALAAAARPRGVGRGGEGGEGGGHSEKIASLSRGCK
jgi:hypothetical protein